MVKETLWRSHVPKYIQSQPVLEQLEDKTMINCNYRLELSSVPLQAVGPHSPLPPKLCLALWFCFSVLREGSEPVLLPSNTPLLPHEVKKNRAGREVHWWMLGQGC